MVLLKGDQLYLEVSQNRGTPKWLVYNGKIPSIYIYINGGTISGNFHITATTCSHGIPLMKRQAISSTVPAAPAAPAAAAAPTAPPGDTDEGLCVARGLDFLRLCHMSYVIRVGPLTVKESWKGARKEVEPHLEKIESN